MRHVLGVATVFLVVLSACGEQKAKNIAKYGSLERTEVDWTRAKELVKNKEETVISLNGVEFNGQLIQFVDSRDDILAKVGSPAARILVPNPSSKTPQDRFYDEYAKDGMRVIYFYPDADYTDTKTHNYIAFERVTANFFKQKMRLYIEPLDLHVTEKTTREQLTNFLEKKNIRRITEDELFFYPDFGWYRNKTKTNNNSVRILLSGGVHFFAFFTDDDKEILTRYWISKTNPKLGGAR